MNFKKFLFFFVIVCFLAISSSSCFAQTGIKASPLRIEELVEPGQVLTRIVKITNISDSQKIFYAYLMDFKARGEGGEAVLVPAGAEEGPFLAGWIDAPKEGIIFDPGEEKQIPITFRVPEETGPGGYYGAIVFGPQAPRIDPEEGAIVALTHQVGILALFHVLGDVVEEARIREFATDKNFYGTPFEVKFLTRVENLSNVHIKPVGVIEIKNIFNKQVAAVPVNQTGANVLPESIRRFENSWQDDFGFGRYTAFLVLNFGTPAHQGGMGVKTVFSQRSFWVIPWKIVTPIFLGLIFFIALFILFLKIYKGKAIKKALQEAGLGQVKYIRKYQGPSPILYFGLIIAIILLLLILIGGAVFFLFFA